MILWFHVCVFLLWLVIQAKLVTVFHWTAFPTPLQEIVGPPEDGLWGHPDSRDREAGGGKPGLFVRIFALEQCKVQVSLKKEKKLNSEWTRLDLILQRFEGQIGCTAEIFQFEIEKELVFCLWRKSGVLNSLRNSMWVHDPLSWVVISMCSFLIV